MAGLQGPYAVIAAIVLAGAFAGLVSGAAYIVVFSVLSGYGAHDSVYGPIDKSGTQHEWTDQERERFVKRQRLALVVAAGVGLTLFVIGAWLIWQALQ